MTWKALFSNPYTTIAGLLAALTILQSGHDWNHVIGAVIAFLWGILQKDAHPELPPPAEERKQA